MLSSRSWNRKIKVEVTSGGGGGATVSDRIDCNIDKLPPAGKRYDPGILPPTVLCRCRIAYFVKPEITKRIYLIRTEHPSKSKCANIMLSFTWKYSQLKALNILHCYSNKNWFSIGKIETWIPSQKISGQNDTPGWRLCGFISVIHLSTNMSI